MVPNRQVQIYGSKKMGSRNWVKLRHLKKIINKKHENVMKTDTSSKLNYYQNWNVTKTVMSPKLKYHHIWNVTKTEVSPKLNCHQNWSVIQTEMLLKLKFYHTLYLSSKITNLNSRDRHWIPRSCLLFTIYYLLLTISLVLSFTFSNK